MPSCSSCERVGRPYSLWLKVASEPTGGLGGLATTAAPALKRRASQTLAADPKHADTRGVMPGGPSVSRIAVELYSTPTVGVGRSYT